MDYNIPEYKPTPYNTRIWLCKSDLDITSGHQLYFATKKAQIDYFTSPIRSIVLEENKYIKNKSGVLNLDIEMVDIDGKFNYLIYQNPNHEGRYFICNILDYQYTSDRVSKVFYSVDNWQTYMHDIDLTKENYIARRHFHKSENETIRNLPFEDLDRGRNNILATETIHRLSGDETFFIITLSNPIYSTFTGNYTNLYNSASTMKYLNSWNMEKVISPRPKVLESTVVFIVNYDALKYLIENVFSTPEHVNKLQKVSYIPFDINVMLPNAKNQFTNATNKPDGGGIRKLYTPSPSTFAKKDEYDVFRNAKNIIRNGIKGDFTKISKDNFIQIPQSNLTAQELYFLRSPFTSVQLNDALGNVSEYDYKEITTTQDDKLNLRVFGSLGIIPTIAYNVKIDDKYTFNEALEELQNGPLDFQLSVASDLDTKYIIPTETISIVNDYTSAFLQANQNQISQQKANINTSFEMGINNINAEARRNMAGANLSFNNSNLQRETNMINFNVGQAVDKSNHSLGMIGQGINMAMGSIGAGLVGGPMAGIGAMATGGLKMGISNQQFGNTLQANSSMFNNSMASSLEIDTNNLQHQQSMIGDMKAQNLRNTSIQSKMSMDTMNSRMLDVKNRPDNIASLTGGTLMNVLFHRYNINILTYVAHPRTINRLSNYLCEYGMMANTKETIKNILNINPLGSYIQTINCNITGDIPQTALNDIKTIFDNGVFLWKDYRNYRKTSLLKNN